MYSSHAYFTPAKVRLAEQARHHPAVGIFTEPTLAAARIVLGLRTVLDHRLDAVPAQGIGSDDRQGDGMEGSLCRDAGRGVRHFEPLELGDELEDPARRRRAAHFLLSRRPVVRLSDSLRE
ncbi:hypothetical protein [Rhodococcus ruber]|uniref:hypothetical protein n=1 Tax=Rhodococcus ruber TaxID=1830 RepID=UPI00315DF4A0